MAAELVYTVASMTLLGIVAVGVARTKLGAPDAACMVAVLPTIVVGSWTVVWLRSLLELHLFAVPAGVGLVVLALVGFTLATE